MAASGVSPSSAQYSEDPATDQSHRSRLVHSKPRRRHSIQVVSGFPFLSRQPSFGHGSITPSENSNTNTNVSDNTSNAHTHNRNRRQSISESLQLVTKSMSRWVPFINSLTILWSLFPCMICPEKYIQYHWFYSSLQKAMHLGSNPSLDPCGPNGNDARFITKAFCRDILGAHYRQPDLKVWLTLLMIKSIFISLQYISCYQRKFWHFIVNLHQAFNVFTRCKHKSYLTHCSPSLKEVWPILRKVDKNNLSGSVLVKMLCSFLQQKLFIV